MYETASCQCGRNAYYENMPKMMGSNRCDTGLLSKMPYAMAFVRPQCDPRLFNPAEGLCRGTMFPDLYSPYNY